MKNIILILSISLFLVNCVFAQPSSNHKKYEVSVGYSFAQPEIDYGPKHQPYSDFSIGIKERDGHHGFNASVVYNTSRYFGVKADVSGMYGQYTPKSLFFGIGSGGGWPSQIRTRNSQYNFLGGVQVKDNGSDKRLKPFIHALVGVGHRRNGVEDDPAYTTLLNYPYITSENGLAVTFGGGLDIQVNGRFAVRIFQVDYNPVRYDKNDVEHKIRIGAGIVL